MPASFFPISRSLVIIAINSVRDRSREISYESNYGKIERDPASPFGKIYLSKN